MARKITCNNCGAELTLEDWEDDVFCECGNNIWIDNDTVYQECSGEFHSDVFEDAIGTSMAEAYEFFGDPDEEDDMMD